MSLLNNNSSLKKLAKKLQFGKSKTNNLLLTDFNKFSLFNCNSKTSKKKININNRTCSNNSMKNRKNIQNTNNYNYIYNNINNKINFNFNNANTNHTGCTSKNSKKIINNNVSKEKKSIDILDINNMPKQINKTIKCNSVNNLIGININVNYMNKNYSINKIKPNSYMTNYNNNYSSNYNIYNGSRKNSKNKIINKSNKINYNNKFLNNSFIEIIKGNNNNIIPNSSSGKNKVNKKNIFIINPLKNDWEKIMDNLKIQKINKSKLDKKEINKSTKIKNQIENKNTISSTEDNNNNLFYRINKTNYNVKNIEKSYSCKNINFIPVQKQNKSSINNNIYFTLMKNMEQKINYLKENYKGDSNKIFETINEFFIKYCNELEDQYQKKLILEIFFHINNLLNQKDKHIMNIQKEKEDIIQKNNKLIEQNNILIQKNNILENKINEIYSINNINNNLILSDNKDDDLKNSNKSSSSVNTEELESIRFFDKIIMKKHSIINIPELSFQKININNNGYKDDNIHKKNIKQRYSFQGNNKINFNNIDKKDNKFNLKIIKNNLNKRTINYYNSGNIQNNQKQKINIRYNQNYKK